MIKISPLSVASYLLPYRYTCYGKYLKPKSDLDLLNYFDILWPYWRGICSIVSPHFKKESSKSLCPRATRLYFASSILFWWFYFMIPDDLKKSTDYWRFFLHYLDFFMSLLILLTFKLKDFVLLLKVLAWYYYTSILQAWFFILFYIILNWNSQQRCQLNLNFFLF